MMVELGLSGFLIAMVGGWSALFARVQVLAALTALAWLALLAATGVRLGLPLPLMLAGFVFGAAAHAVMLHAIKTGGIAR